MPVNLQELVRAIDQRMPEIRMMSEQQRDHANRGEDLVRELNGLDLDGFVSRLPPEPKGALPMLEGNETGLDWRLLREFREEFTDMVGAREWARAILSNRSVGAVDGSQIFPGNELSLPFGLVNIGWYINHHDGNYTTDHSSRLLLPDDLGYNPDSGVNLLRERGEIDKLRELFGSSGKGDLLLLDGSLVLSYALHVFDTTRDSYINGILSLLETIGQEDGPLFAAYIDNSRATDLSTMLGPLLTTRSKLIEEGGEKEGNGEVSHVEGRKEEMVVDEERKGVVKEGEMVVDEKRRGMVKEGEMVVDEKRREVVNEGEMVVVDEGRKGVVKEGEMVVDEERKEVVKEGEMVVVDEGRKEGGEDSNEEEDAIAKMGGGRGRPQDAVLLNRSMEWGDRTSAFVCTRDDILQYYVTGDRDRSRDILFFYLKTSLGRVARVEFPRRIADEGRVEELADVIRAQTIIGGGYPHALDQAHHEANVSMSERERFLKLLISVAGKNNLEMGTSLKAAKKRQ